MLIDTTPMMSLSTFLISFIALAFIARLAIEFYIYRTETQKARRSVGRRKAGSNRIASVSEQAIKRYYSRNNAENKGA